MVTMANGKWVDEEGGGLLTKENGVPDCDQTGEFILLIRTLTP